MYNGKLELVRLDSDGYCFTFSTAETLEELIQQFPAKVREYGLRKDGW